ncbi:MAG: tetratricopeptide repeat protein [Syntrophales bacterium]
MKKNATLFSFVFIFILLLAFPPIAFCQPPISLEAGIQQYREDNYEEAIEILTQVRGNDQKSSMAAYFLGLAYKKVMDYPNAAVHLEAAVTLTPKIREALVELIDDLYQMGKIDESKRWIQLAEKENIFPAKIAFLKGLVLSKENRNREAIEALETAKKLDPSLAQASDFQIALCYMKDKKSVQAKEILGAVIERDPLSDLAAYARRYQDVVEKDIYMERPLRLTIGIYGSYDTNILAKPADEAAASGITGEKAYVLTSSVRLDYVPRFEGPWLFNAGYAFASSLHSEHTQSIDSMANTFYISPGYSFGRVALNLYAAYTDALLRTDPDLFPDPDSNPGYKRYFNYMTYGPIVRVLVTQNNILELFAGYDKKDYYNQKKTFPTRTDSFYDDNRDAAGPRAYVSWVWMFRENAFLNLRYEFNQDHSDGSWWENEGHMFSINASIPLLADATAKRTGQVKLQLSGSAFFQNYKYDQTFVDEDGTTKTEPRKDETYTGSIGLSWDFWKYATFLVQYQKIRAYSNMPIYDYDRNIYMTGFEFRF